MAVCAIVMSFVTASGYADERLPSGPLLKSDQVIERFRQGVDFIVSDLEKARAIFEDIYRQPNSSQALRFQSKYNLGWIAACEADRLLAEDPQQALAQLELSREAFQDAVELNPGHIPTRQNLEVIALRAKQLRDAQEPKDNSASKELDQLTQRQRELNQEMDNQNKNDSTPGEEGQSGEQGATNSQAEGAPEEAKDAESQRPREDTEALTERQEELARKAEDLAEQMQREATPGPRDDAQDIAKDGVGEEAEDPQTEPKEAMAPEQAAQEIESAAKEMQQAASTAKKEGSNSRDAQNLRESALEKLEKARKLLGLEKEPNEAQPQEQEKEPEQQQEQGANDANQAAQTEQEMSGISQLLQLIRDREAQRMKDRGNGRWTVDEPVAEDW